MYISLIWVRFEPIFSSRCNLRPSRGAPKDGRRGSPKDPTTHRGTKRPHWARNAQSLRDGRPHHGDGHAGRHNQGEGGTLGQQCRPKGNRKTFFYLFRHTKTKNKRHWLLKSSLNTHFTYRCFFMNTLYFVLIDLFGIEKKMNANIIANFFLFHNI